MNARMLQHTKSASTIFVVLYFMLMNSLPTAAATRQVGVAQLAVSTWDRTYHGAAFDSFTAVVATSDGGFIATASKGDNVSHLHLPGADCLGNGDAPGREAWTHASPVDRGRMIADEGGYQRA